MTAPHDEPDSLRVAQTVLHERQCRDRAWWDQMARCFWPDSTVRLSWYDGDGPGFVAGSKKITEAGLVTVHRMYAPVVHLSGAKALVEASAAVSTTVDVNGIAGDLVSHARLNYRLHRRDGQWRILSLDSIYEHVTLAPAVPGQPIAVDPAELTPFRPSYCLLAWQAWRAGRATSSDLLGDDRPEAVAAFYYNMFRWLRDDTIAA